MEGSNRGVHGALDRFHRGRLVDFLERVVSKQFRNLLDHESVVLVLVDAQLDFRLGIGVVGYVRTGGLITGGLLREGRVVNLISTALNQAIPIRNQLSEVERGIKRLLNILGPYLLDILGCCRRRDIGYDSLLFYFLFRAELFSLLFALVIYAPKR